MKKIAKHLLSLFVLTLIFVPALSMAALDTSKVGITGTDGIEGKIDLGKKTPVETATSLINFGMTFLALIAVVIVIAAGFKWMTAGGSDEKITEAKKLMTAGVVGIVIILSAWGIARYVLEKLITEVV